MNERFKNMINYLLEKKIEFSQNDIAKKIGISSGYISELIQAKKKISKQIVSKLVDAYPQLNVDYLKTGDGEMLKKTEIHNTISNTGAFSTNTINGDLGTQLSELISEQKELRKDFMSLMNEKNKQINDLIEIVKKNNGGI